MFKGQITTETYLLDVFYVVAALCVLLAILGLGFIDSGLSRKKNVEDAWVQKLIACVVGAFAYMFIGYAVWNWQYATAFGGGFNNALDQWWLGGSGLTHFAQFLDPKVIPQADVFQVFWVFFLVFAMFLGAIIQSATLERIRPVALYTIIVVLIAGPWTILSYLVWGSVSPLTNLGVHDYVGVFNLYIFAGVVSVVLNWRLGPRMGAWAPAGLDAASAEQRGTMVAGVFLLMFAIPGIVLGSGFIVPGLGYFGISMTTSGIGIALSNTIAAFIGGGLAGAILAFRKRQAVWALFGPITGYIACAAMLDIGKPWEMLIIAPFGPLVAYGTASILRRLRIDDQKVGPLTLGPGIFAAIVAGFVGWNVKTGGYFGLTGKYGFQHARITPWWQLVGVAVTVAIAAVSCLVLCAIFERIGKLRVSEEAELLGLDATYWGLPPGAAPATAPTEAAGLE